MPISGPCGSYLGGPYRIIHHTTEGPTAAAAFSSFRSHRSDPHFTVDDHHVYQHIDTGAASRSLRHLRGEPETNRQSAVQIEIVGTAARPKSRPTLENVARLCRWIEQTHHIPAVWPNGPPKPAVNGRDPGGHNRNLQVWVTHGGHYGHSNVPENIHWDPGYTPNEAMFVLRFSPGQHGLVEPEMEELRESFPEHVPLTDKDIAIPDHGDDAGEPDADEPGNEMDEEPLAAEDGKERGSHRHPGLAVFVGAIVFAGTFVLLKAMAPGR
jgi:hypothetical protein